MSTIIERARRALAAARAIANTAVAAATGAAALLTEVSEQVVTVLPGGVGQDIARWALIGAGWLTAAALAMRRVTPVPAAARGIQPPEGVTITRTPTAVHVTTREVHDG